MYEMNKDLPYEQQVKILLRYFDQQAKENKALKARIKEIIYESRGNGNGITYPSIKVRRGSVALKNAHFLSFFVYFSENH